MTDELKPVRCGCGGEAKVIKHEYFECSPTYGVTCYKCGTATNQGFDTEAEAIQAWNTAMGGNHFRDLTKMMERTAKVEVVEKPNVFKCSECGQYMHQVSWCSPVKYCSRCGARLEWK